MFPRKQCFLGEVLKIRQPLLPNKPKNTQPVPVTDPLATSSKAGNNPDVPVIPRKADSQIVIPGNVTMDHVPSKITRCTVSLECLSDPPGRNAKELTNKSSQGANKTDSNHGYVMRS